MDIGLEHACQLLMAAAQSKSFISCKTIFDLMDYSSVNEKLEKINGVLHSYGLRAIRVKHSGVYCLSVVDAIEQPQEHYKWLRGVLPPNNLKTINEERGAYILVRILLYYSQQECDINVILDTLVCTAKPPGWQQEQSDERMSDTSDNISISIRQAWLETIERFITKGWLLKTDTRISSASDMSQTLICEKNIGKLISDLNHRNE